jgi:site-specific DNA-cytosine methylase
VCSTVTQKWGTGGNNVTGTLLPDVVGALTAKNVNVFGAPNVDGWHYLPVAIGNVQDGEVTTLSSREFKGLSCGRDGMTSAAVIETPTRVRRLTPVECERLQGFPDQYTNIPWRKKPESPDGLRYKALGNSMAVPVMRWIGQRITQVEEIVCVSA